MTRISTVGLLIGTLAMFALSAHGARALQVVTPKIHMPKVKIDTPKPKTGEIVIHKETDSSSPKLFENVEKNVDSAALRKIDYSPTKSKTKSPKVGGIVIQKETDSTSPVLMRRTLIDANHP